MRDDDLARTEREGPGGLPAQGEQGGVAAEEHGQEAGAPAVQPDVVADTLEALQARADAGGREALRGTIDRSDLRLAR